MSGTRGRRWTFVHATGLVLVLSCHGSAQLRDSARSIARFDKREQTSEGRDKVHGASLETSEASKAPEAKVITASYAPAATSPLAEKEPRSLVRRASLVVTEGRPLPTFRRAGLLDAELVAEIRDAAKTEKIEGGTGGQ